MLTSALWALVKDLKKEIIVKFYIEKVASLNFLSSVIRALVSISLSLYIFTKHVSYRDRPKGDFIKVWILDPKIL